MSMTDFLDRYREKSLNVTNSAIFKDYLSNLHAGLNLSSIFAGHEGAQLVDQILQP